MIEKDLKNFEKELGNLLSRYMDTQKVIEKEDDYPNTHDFFKILEDCEDLIKRVNK